jgi:hypothetical protein
VLGNARLHQPVEVFRLLLHDDLLVGEQEGVLGRLPCLVRLPGVCSFDPETTIAAHSNSSSHGKAGARKANDEYSVWCCFHCHSWLDQGRASAAAKELAFMRAHLTQVCEWRAIAGSTAADPRDRAAAQWALDHLNATPVGGLESPL